MIFITRFSEISCYIRLHGYELYYCVQFFFRCLVLFDVEGLLCPKKKDAAHDLKLFALATLTSSTVIYNTMSAVNTSQLSGLHFGSQIAKEFIPNHQSADNLSSFFPTLVWVIRDQFLDIEIEEDGEIKAATADQYMEHCLTQDSASSAIKDNFRIRKCFALPDPVERKLMKKLDQIPAEDLNEDFVLVTKELLDFVIQDAKTKSLIHQNGETFAYAFQNFLLSIENKDLNLESVYDHVEIAVNQKAFEQAMQSFKESLAVEAKTFPGNILNF